MGARATLCWESVDFAVKEPNWVGRGKKKWGLKESVR